MYPVESKEDLKESMKDYHIYSLHSLSMSIWACYGLIMSIWVNMGRMKIMQDSAEIWTLQCSIGQKGDLDDTNMPKEMTGDIPNIQGVL